MAGPYTLDSKPLSTRVWASEWDSQTVVSGTQGP